jgi:hypothetical protein
MAARWAYELQHRYREALFGQTPFDELPLSCGQTRFEHVDIAVNIPLMISQSGDTPVVHNGAPNKTVF